MSASSVKETRRQIRRAAGVDALKIVEEIQQNNRALAASLSQAHQRIDALESSLMEHKRQPHKWYVGS
jgi:D-ribose pyranose/furanose isomerase RbsD